ncbi:MULTISPECIES: DNA polymerase III subunit delta [Staphylococcus]|jgi:DNA polymerase-3 subunit delta|uniref:DNA polymerase III subunit delta n=5 Tax=Staphylococcus hominis TaxID=1290 RepID=A0A3S7GY43_STAHO|nr:MULTISPECIES: DNA polymerase III subunit delta [Staphylococcus]EUZ70501.1 DNA polymerase III, delta subunit [Staphylococcus sp. M0480]OFK81986.1 DNA polymerase III subunit delta [Staphylococcus sp. HMSC057A02]OFM61900.1 DNA polymerase III subunit delta [Staphylococcus sp. HMSC062C01]OFM91159.1 DNA polymerase III subunit delta [Staphylococcus sp. HMSC078D05]OFS48830.1 DNA polymerase III subunit delta [Staphylococcus sp. HMSC075H09]OHO59055.1 DNA polymerase III subunit delta [Staphylococcus 
MANNIMAIYGEVPELVEKKSNEIVESYLNEKKDDFNYVKYNLYDTSFNQIIEEALTMPFISEKKAIVVKNAFIFTGEKVSKDIQPNNEQVNEFLEKYDGENFIIFEVYQNKLDERKKITKTLKKTSKLAKVEQMSEQEIKNWIKNKLHENFKDIKQDALDLFIELTGINFNIVSQELEKIILFLGERTTINKKDVEEIINRSLEQNVFLLTEYIQKGEKYKAIQLIKDLIVMKEEPIKLLALITSNYRLYYQCKILSRKGYSGQQIAKTINVHPYRVKLALNQVKHYQLTHLLNIIDQCAETDYKLKSSYMDKQLILELFILSL